MSTDDTIETKVSWVDNDQEGHTACITFHRPAKLNVINRKAMTTLREMIVKVSKRPDLRCVILNGGGDKAFIGGADITDMFDLDPKSAREFITRLHRVCQAIRDCPAPVIARIDGYCLGAGMEIAAACDLRIATTTSQFGMPEVQVGIPSVIEAVLLPRLIGWGKTSELLLTGKIISAHEAESIGFVERVVQPDKLDSALKEWTTAMLSAGPLAIWSQKSLIRQWETLNVDDGIRAGIDAFAHAFTTDEPKTYMLRFLKR
ncbi:MAG TPA: enoyl-CoA hydratase [Candidatus Hydrogenedentes bacterium]|nr:enoyl-CoA hydratase [Candidatus Hydrogenedentota bacterium]